MSAVKYSKNTAGTIFILPQTLTVCMGLGGKQADRRKDRFRRRQRRGRGEDEEKGLKEIRQESRKDRHRGRQRKSDGLGPDRILQRDWLADVGGRSTC